MKILIVYFSRTGTTKKIAEALKTKLNADIEEINDPTDRKGVFGYLKSGKEATQKIMPEIGEIKSDLKSYDLVVVGTPVWAWNISSPMRSFAVKYLIGNPAQIAVFCTQGGSGSDTAQKTIEELSGKKTLGLLALNTKEVLEGKFEGKIEEFSKKILRY